MATLQSARVGPHARRVAVDPQRGGHVKGLRRRWRPAGAGIAGTPRTARDRLLRHHAGAAHTSPMGGPRASSDGTGKGLIEGVMVASVRSAALHELERERCWHNRGPEFARLPGDGSSRIRNSVVVLLREPL